MVGWNSRLDELQAAVLRVKLKYLDEWNEQRRRLATRYHGLLADANVELPLEAPYAKHVYHLYTLRSKHRESIRACFRERGIAFGVYYPLPLHYVEAYRNLEYGPGSFPESERAAEENLAIPLYVEMTDDDLAAVVSAVKESLVAEPTAGSGSAHGPSHGA